MAQLQWDSMGGPPGAGRVTELVQTVGGPHSLFALTAHGVYQSIDRGEQWNLLPEPEGINIADIAVRGETLITCGDGVHSVAGTTVTRLLDGPCGTVAAQGETVVIGTGALDLASVRVQRLSNADDWDDLSPAAADLEDLTLPTEDLEYGVEVTSIASLGDTVLAGFTVLVEGSGHTNGGLYRRGAADRAWTRISFPLSADVVVHRISVDPRDSRRVVVAFRHTAEGARSPLAALVYESVDGGETWLTVTDFDEEVSGVTDVVRAGSVTYVLNPADGYLLRIEDGKWAVVGMPLVPDFPGVEFLLERLLFDPVDPEVAYGMTLQDWEIGLVRSTDAMQTWHKMDRTLVGSSPTIVITHPDDPSTVLTTSNVIQESYATSDGGATWQPLTPAPRDDELRIDPHDPRHLILIDESTGLYESRDGGLSFSPLGGNFTSAKLLDVEIAADEQGTIYVSNLGIGISRLAPDGPIHMSGSPDYAYDIEVDPDDPRILYATNSPKKFEHHSSVWRYDPDQPTGFGWSEILRIEESAGITSVAFDPSDTDTLYAGATGSDGTVWVSHDRGESWAVLNPALTFTTVQGQSQLLVDSRDVDTALVATWGAGSYRTTDGGGTWSLLDETHLFSPTCLAEAPSDADVIYACDRTAAKIHRSTDGGTSWSEYFDFGPDHLTTTAVAVDPNDPELIYVAAFRPPAAMLGSLYQIRQGQVVDDIGGSLPRAAIEIEIDHHDPARLYVTTHLHGLFATDDAGTTWTQLDDRDTGLPRTGYLDVDVDPVNPFTVYATSLCGELPGYVVDPVQEILSTTQPFRNLDPTAACGLYRSDDRGESWGLVFETIGEAKGIDISASNPDRLYLADSAGGVWSSSDAGATWRQDNDGLPTSSVSGVAVAEDRVYAATQGSGVFIGTVTSTGELEWADSNGPRAYVHRLQVEVDPSNSSRIYASAYPGGVLRSDDGGRTWSARNFLTPSIRVTDPVLQGYYALDIDPADPETVWLGVYGKGVIVSHDGREFGASANGIDQVLLGKHITSVAIDPRDSSRVVVGSEEGLFMTTNGGRSWEQQAAGLDTTDIRTIEFADATVEPDDTGSSRLFIGTGGYGLYEFDHAAASWTNAGPTFGVAWWTHWERRMYQFSSIAFDSEVDDRVFLGHFPSGFFVSDDAGHSWRDSSVGLGNDGMFSLTQHPEDPAVFFAGTYNGVVTSSDGGATWIESSAGMPTEQWPYTIAIDDAAPTVMYASTKNGQNKGFCHRNDFCGVVMKSVDGGRSWRRIMNGLDDRSEFYTLLIYPPNHDVLFLSSSNGVFVSDDAGDSWWPMTSGLPATSNQVRDNVAENLALSADSRDLYLGLVSYGVWRLDLRSLAD